MKYFNLFLILIGQFLFAQNLSNNLNGEFTTKAKDSMYPYLIFDGNGTVDVSGYKSYPFFERNDSVVILVDKGTFILKKDKTDLVGISEWIEGSKYKLKTSTKAQNTNAGNLERAKLYASYYDVNFISTQSLYKDDINENELNSLMKSLLAKNEKMCEENLDLACIQSFSLKLTEEVGGLESTLNLSNDFVLKPNTYFVNLGNKIVSLGNPEGYGLLATYYMLTKDKVRSDEMIEKGLEEGCEMCLTISLQNLED